jgi:hypothetical protein
MREFILKLWRGRSGSYIAFFLLLVGSAVLVSGVMSQGSGCYTPPGHGCGDTWPDPVNSSAGWNQTSGPGYTLRAIFDGTNNAAQPGQMATHYLGSEGMTVGTTGTYIWTPPPDAHGFLFSRPPEPGGPPFVWEGLAPNTSITVSFYFPQKPAGVVGAWKVTEYFEVDTSDGQFDRAVHTTALGGSAAQPADPQAARRAASESAGMVWELARWFDFPGVDLDTTACQSWIDFLRDKQAFFAVRMPVTSTASGSAVRVPFVSGANYPSMLRIQRYWPAAYVYTATLELRPERLTFLANTLPEAAGEQWLAFGVAPDAPACPAGLSIKGGNWTAMGTLFLDLSHRPDNCVGCILPIYFCYEGQEPPLASLTFSLAGNAAPAAEGITCFGPQDVPIEGGPNWNVMGAGSRAAMPPASVRFLHAVSNHTGVERDFNVSYQSDLAVTWRMYGGTSTAPDLGQALTSTVRLTDNQYKFIWLISDPLPAETRPGSYSLRFIAALASAPTASRWASDIIWVGDWVPPPSPLPTVTSIPTEPSTATETPTATRTPTRTPTKTSTATRTPAVTATPGGPSREIIWLPVVIRKAQTSASP